MLTHLGEDGRPAMVDVTDKPATSRSARAVGRVRMSAEALELATTGRAAKGEVLRTAELAGVMAAKRTADLVPLCHPLPLSKVAVSVTPVSVTPGGGALEVAAEVRTRGPTGVEMEALTAVTVACLTIYDMLKAVDRAMVIEAVRVTMKAGGAHDFEDAAATER